MVYHWDDKEADCYRLYVEEKKSLAEVIAYWKNKGFTPRCVNDVNAYTANRTACTGGSPLYHGQTRDAINEEMNLTSFQQTGIPDPIQGMLPIFYIVALSH